jgi:UDP-N-acetylmuramyl pentapeptide phosphotransferase/UDP-N-acetylglucosamine-1-phosphate transferase
MCPVSHRAFFYRQNGLSQVGLFGGFRIGLEAIKFRLSCLMRKNNPHLPTSQTFELSGIAYILAFLIGVLLFLIFGKSVFGVTPDPFWIALLMGLSVSAIVFWIWGKFHNREREDNDD